MALTIKNTNTLSNPGLRYPEKKIQMKGNLSSKRIEQITHKHQYGKERKQFRYQQEIHHVQQSNYLNIWNAKN